MQTGVTAVPVPAKIKGNVTDTGLPSAATLTATADQTVSLFINGKNIPVVMPELTSGLQDQMSMMGAQLVALENLVSIMRDQTTISTKILQASNN